MLRELRLNNLAIIKDLNLEFDEGLISMTGETGAGKSIILDGISLLIGERSHLEMIRTNEEGLYAEGIFDLNENQKKKLNELGFEIEDDELIVLAVEIEHRSKVYLILNKLKKSFLK